MAHGNGAPAMTGTGWHPYRGDIEAIHDAVNAIDNGPRPTGGGVIDLWLDVDEEHSALSMIRGELAIDAALAARALLEERGEPVRADLETPSGRIIHLRPGSRSSMWRGYDLVGALAIRYVDHDTGEVVHAVPVPVLHDVLPGCSTPELTSSRWTMTGLKRHMRVSPWKFRLDEPDEDPLLTIRRGRGWIR